MNFIIISCRLDNKFDQCELNFKIEIAIGVLEWMVDNLW